MINVAYKQKSNRATNLAAKVLINREILLKNFTSCSYLLGQVLNEDSKKNLFYLSVIWENTALVQ